MSSQDRDDGVVQEEARWAKAHPEGGATEVPDLSLLVLWNFAVGRATLKPEHENAIAQFLALNRLQSNATIELEVTGYASATGAPDENEVLAKRRAEAVAAFLKSSGFSHVSAGRGTWPWNLIAGRSGAALAHDRRVEVRKYLPPSSEARPVAPPSNFYAPPKPLESALADVEASAVSVTGTVTFEAGSFWIGDTLFKMSADGIVELKTAQPHALQSLKAQVKNEVGERNDGRNKTNDRNKTGFGVLFQQKLADEYAAELSGSFAEVNKLSGMKLALKCQSAALEKYSIYETKFGVQTAVYWFFISVKMIKWTLLDVEWRGVRMSVEFSGTVKFDIKPSERVLAMMGEVAAVGAVFLIAAAIIGGTILGIEDQTENLRRTSLYAARDSFASRAAFEVCGSTAFQELADRKIEWSRFRDATARQAALEAYHDLDLVLVRMPSKENKALKERWTKDYAKEGLQFVTVRQAMFRKLGANSWRGPPPTLEAL